MDCITWQASLSMRFSRQEYWNGLPFPSPKDLPDPGIKTASPALQADSLPAYILIYIYIYSDFYMYAFPDSFPLWVIL